jgi:Zn finger protein HypA/HybF involved in hydrogenase expression
MIEAIKCNDCQFIGEEDDLKILKDNTEYFKGCPNCKTDSYLMDVKTITELK